MGEHITPKADQLLGYYITEIEDALKNLEEFGEDEFESAYNIIGDALLRLRAEGERFGLKDKLNKVVIEYKEATDLWNEMNGNLSKRTAQNIAKAVEGYEKMIAEFDNIIKGE